MATQEDSDSELESMTNDFCSMLADLDEEDRAVILTELNVRFCMCCGSEQPKDGSDCPCGDAAEDDEDDEDDEDEDEDDEDEDEDDSGDDGDPDEEDEEGDN